MSINQIQKLKDELSFFEKEKQILEDKLSTINRQIELYQKSLSSQEHNLEVSLESEDIKTKVFIYRWTYNYSLKDIAKLTNYSLVYIKKISAELSKEMKGK